MTTTTRYMTTQYFKYIYIYISLKEKKSKSTLLKPNLT